MPVMVDVLAHAVRKDGAASDMTGDMQSPVIRKEEQLSTQLASKGFALCCLCLSVVNHVLEPQSDVGGWVNHQHQREELLLPAMLVRRHVPPLQGPSATASWFVGGPGRGCVCAQPREGELVALVWGSRGPTLAEALALCGPGPVAAVDALALAACARNHACCVTVSPCASLEDQRCAPVNGSRQPPWLSMEVSQE